MVKSQSTFYAGLLFIAIGLLFLFTSVSYPIGVASKMGPGYFPVLLSVVLICLGVVNIVKSIIHLNVDTVTGLSVKPLFFVLFANIVFGILLPKVGFVLSTITLVAIASQSSKATIKEVLILSMILATTSSVIFIGMLSMPFKLFPWS